MSLMTVLTSLAKNPYSDVYETMDEYELVAWKAVFQQAINSGASNWGTMLRLRAIDRALEDIKSHKIQRAA